MQRCDDVLGHPQRLHLGDVGVHLPRRFGVRRVLEDHPDAVDLEFLDGLFDVTGGRNQADRTGRHGLAEALADIAMRACGQQQAVLIEQPPVHRVAGIDVLGNREIHEVDGSDDWDLAGPHIRFVDDAAHATPVVAMRVRIDHAPRPAGPDRRAAGTVSRPREPASLVTSGSKTIQPVLPRTKEMSDRSKPRT